MHSGASSDRLRKPQVALVFRFHPSFQILRRFFLLPQELLDSRKGAARGGGPGFNGFVGAIKIVPGDRFHFGAKNEIGVPLPNLELVFLRSAHGAAYDLKNVCRSAQVAILHAHGYSKDRGCAEFPRGSRGNRCNKTAVCKAACANFHRFEQARKRATRPDGVHQTPLRKYNWFARREVRGHRRKRNPQIFKLSGFEYAFDQISKTIVAGKAEPRNPPASDIAKPQRAASGDDARKRRAARVRRAKNAAHAGSCNVRYGDFILFENLQDAQMCETARESTAKREAQPWPNGGRG